MIQSPCHFGVSKIGRFSMIGAIPMVETNSPGLLSPNNSDIFKNQNDPISSLEKMYDKTKISPDDFKFEDVTNKFRTQSRENLN